MNKCVKNSSYPFGAIPLLSNLSKHQSLYLERTSVQCRRPVLHIMCRYKYLLECMKSNVNTSLLLFHFPTKWDKHNPTNPHVLKIFPTLWAILYLT